MTNCTAPPLCTTSPPRRLCAGSSAIQGDGPPSDADSAAQSGERAEARPRTSSLCRQLGESGDGPPSDADSAAQSGELAEARPRTSSLCRQIGESRDGPPSDADSAARSGERAQAGPGRRLCAGRSANRGTDRAWTPTQRHKAGSEQSAAEAVSPSQQAPAGAAQHLQSCAVAGAPDRGLVRQCGVHDLRLVRS
jgi:hypothetical protein